MPSIEESRKADLSKYVPAAPMPPVSMVNVEHHPRTVNNLRCPLPPFNFSPDTVRDFELGNRVPQVRVIPLPVNSAVGSTTINNTQITNNTTSSTGTTTSLTSKTQTLVTPILTPGTAFTSTIVLAKSFQLLQITSTDACDIRLYGALANQLQDASRSPDAPVPAETTGIITNVVFDTSPFQISLQNRIGANFDSPQSSTIYVTVINTTLATTQAYSLGFQYIPLES